MPRGKPIKRSHRTASSALDSQPPNGEGQRQEIAVLSNAAQDAPLPRAKRQRHRAKSDRGLPPDQELTRPQPNTCDTNAKAGPSWSRQVS
jgi:hypothetical protein